MDEKNILFAHTSPNVPEHQTIVKRKQKNQLMQEPWEDDGEPVDDLKEGGDAESKTEAKEAPQGGEELDWTHSNLPLQFWGE